MTCDVDDCERSARSRGWCEMHYSRWVRTGSPLITYGRVRGGDEWASAFSDRVDKAEPGCWLWTGALNASGYGILQYLGKHWYAHRLSYSIAKGEIGDLTVDHRCFNRACIKPDHLRLVTRYENGTTHEHPNDRPDFCRNGHERTDENTVLATTSLGTTCRCCVICRGIRTRKASAIYAAKQKARRDGLVAS